MTLFKNPIIVSADHHVHAFKAHSHMTPSGLNSRLVVCLSVFPQIVDYATEHILNTEGPGDKVLHLLAGDLVHSRTTLDILTGTALRAELDRTQEAGIETKAVEGNHDLYLRGEGITSLSLFEPSVQVVKGSHMYNVGGMDVQVFGISFEPDIETLEKQLEAAGKAKDGDVNILMLHHGISGAVVGPNDYVLKDDLSLSSLEGLGYDWVFCGHYHTNQELGDGTVIMVGSPVQHNFGERGKDKGFLVVDLEEETWDIIPVNAPKFVQAGIEGELPEDWRDKLLVSSLWVGNYVKVVFDNLDAYRAFEPHVDILRDEGVLSLTRELKNINKRPQKTRVSGVEHGVSVREMIERYVKQIAPKGKRKALTETGLMLLEEAENQ